MMTQTTSADLLGISLECRQQIFGYLFADVIEQDVTFNIYYSMVASMSHTFDGQKRLPRLLWELIGDGWENTVFFPHTQKLTSTLAAVHPIISNEIGFLARKARKESCRDYDIITKSPESALEWWTNHGLTTTVGRWWSRHNRASLIAARRAINQAQRNTLVHGVIRPGYRYVNLSRERIELPDPNVLVAIDEAFHFDAAFHEPLSLL
jgi:hypothetical protein